MEIKKAWSFTYWLEVLGDLTTISKTHTPGVVSIYTSHLVVFEISEVSSQDSKCKLPEYLRQLQS